MTTRTIFKRDETAQIDYKLLSEQEFDAKVANDEFMFVQHLEQCASEENHEQQSMFYPFFDFIFGPKKSKTQ